MTYNFFWIRLRQSLMMGTKEWILWIHSSYDVLACDLGPLPVSSPPPRFNHDITLFDNREIKRGKSPNHQSVESLIITARYPESSPSPISVGMDLITGQASVIKVECSLNAWGTWLSREAWYPAPLSCPRRRPPEMDGHEHTLREGAKSGSKLPR